MKNKLFSLLFAIPLIILLSKNAMAHCPLCTIGAGALGAGAIWLGVSSVVVALFIGAFAMSMGMWFARIIKKQYVPFQKNSYCCNYLFHNCNTFNFNANL